MGEVKKHLERVEEEILEMVYAYNKTRDKCSAKEREIIFRAAVANIMQKAVCEWCVIDTDGSCYNVELLNYVVEIEPALKSIKVTPLEGGGGSGGEL